MMLWCFKCNREVDEGCDYCDYRNDAINTDYDDEEEEDDA